jgi:hypothetical protein
VQGLFVDSVQTTSQSVIIGDVNPCLRYWVLVSAVNCGSRVDSSPKLVDLGEVDEFMFVIVLEERDVCATWILEDGITAYVHREVTSQLLQCQLQVLCTADNVLSCGTNHTDVEYR